MIHLSESEARKLRLLGLTPPPPGVTRPTSPGEINGLERSFRDERLEPALQAGRIMHHRFGAVKFRLAGRTWYTPDFLVLDGGGPIWLVEVKGFWRDDAKVKVKVAASLYPCFGWLVATRGRGRRGQWQAYEVGPGGITRRPLDGFQWDS